MEDRTATASALPLGGALKPHETRSTAHIEAALGFGFLAILLVTMVIIGAGSAHQLFTQLVHGLGA
jgi:hypothetical protein